MSELRKEMTLSKERRHRAIEHLVKESIINILAEQELDLSVNPAPAPPVPQQTSPTTETPPPPPPVATPEQTVPKQYTVDDMIRELNAIRSGRSFTDPEIYGRLVTFFKNLSEEQRAILDELLTKIAELVTSVEDSAVVQQQSNQSGQAQTQPPVEAPQQTAPMPGAQQSAGAAGVGAV